MEIQSHKDENLRSNKAPTVDPGEITQFINQRESERGSLSESNLPQLRGPPIIIKPPSDASNDQDAKSDASRIGYSYPSTINDRGNSERLRDNQEDTFRPLEAPEPQEGIFAGTGSWLEVNEKGDMAKQLRDAMIDSADGKKFLPLDKLDMIVTEKAVHSVLSHNHQDISAHRICQRHEIIENDRTQYTSCQKIFAILVLMGEVKLMSGFLEEGIRDWDLPLKSWNTRESTFLVARQNEENPGPLYRLQTANEWSASQIDFFQSQQWIVCAAFFSRAEHLGEKVHLYQLSPHDVLPFIKPGTDDRGNPAYLNQGFFSTVRRVKIHPAHHNFPIHRDNPGADFAVKEIIRIWDENEKQGSAKDYRKSFDQEVQALKRFCQRNERYIVKLLATYEIDGKYYLLFPAADGNLMNNWEENPEPTGIPALWLAKECLGISQGLHKIHKYTYTPPGITTSSLGLQHIPNHGIHGDIKPQNILWFKRLPGHLVDDTYDKDSVSQVTDSSGLGFLQISDFGTVKFHRYMSMRGNDILVRGNTYRAPESDLPGSRGSPAIDIWAYGCLCLDLITWYVRGGQSVCDDFPMARSADEPKQLIEGFCGDDKFYITKDGLLTRRKYHIVKPRVSEWIMHLRREPRCSQFVHDFLDFIETQMLIVDPEERCECPMVVETLQQFLQRCMENPEYYDTGRPHTWMNPRSNFMLLKAKVRQFAQFVDSHGQVVSLIFAVVASAGLVVSNRYLLF
ncbi:kinase-like protein [Daldinia grandis]|nr:kinase-like protein [Daldinia grandis]